MGPDVIAVSVTERGRALAARLPFARVHGDAAATVRARWNEVDGFVLFLAAGAAVRIIGPLLTDKHRDPAVVCVDDAGRFAIPIAGGHAAGANALARRVAGLLGDGCEAVVTTATDATGVTALDQLPGFVATGDVAAVTTALLDGRRVNVDNELDWPVPTALSRIVITDRTFSKYIPHRNVWDVLGKRLADGGAGTAVLHPPSLVAGVGASSGAPADEIDALLEDALASGGFARASVAEIATIDLKANEPGIVALGLPVRVFSAAALERVPVPTPSDAVRKAVGTSSVAEAAALLAAGNDASLVVTKRVSRHATVAIARRRRPRGRLAIVGLGPGDVHQRTPAAEVAVRSAEVVIGYGAYVDQCADLLTAAHDVVRSPIGEEAVRAKQAVAEAATGRRVALVCSGDAGIYAMASLVLELVDDALDVDVEVVPGVTASLAAAAVLGAPLGHDHVTISLSDLLTPWPVIERRIRAAADADLVVALYNPRSRGRPWQLGAAREILLEQREPTTPVGVVTDAARPGQRATITTLAALDPDLVGMTTCVVIGSSTTTVVAGRMVTPRGYRC